MIALGCDHAGFALKEAVAKHLAAKGVAYQDLGTFSEESVDYPDYGFAVAQAVASGACEKGILICGTGIGIGIAANKVPGIRAALCNDLFSAQASREHNDANVLTMGARIIDETLALQIVDRWLATEFAGGRHQRRIDKITAIEEKMALETAARLGK